MIADAQNLKKSEIMTNEMISQITTDCCGLDDYDESMATDLWGFSP